MCSLRQERRLRVPCFSTSHSAQLQGDCRDIGGASSQSHFGVRLDIGFEELTVAGTPNLSTLRTLGSPVEARIACVVINRITSLGMPIYRKVA